MEIKDLKMEALDPVSWWTYGREALELLSRIMDDDDCRYDHNDFCQAHYRSGRPCPHERARELLADLEKEVNNGIIGSNIKS